MKIAARFWSLVIAVGLICFFLSPLALGCTDNRMARKTYAYILTGQMVDGSWTGAVAQFQVTSDGVLKPLKMATLPIGTVPTALAVSPDCRYLYAYAQGYTNAVTYSFLRFSITNDGTLAPNPVISWVEGWGYPFTLSPDGRFAFLPLGNTVNTYRISTSGRFTLVSTAPAGNNACTVAIDPTGQFAFAGNFHGQSISEYKVGVDGELTPTGTISSDGLYVYFLGFSPEGFLYSIGEFAPKTTVEYSIDSSTGTLTELNDFGSYGHLPYSFAFSPTGAYTYMAINNSGGNTISTFRVDKTNGALVSQGAAIPISGPYSPQIAMDPTGQYVVALSGETVWQFKISKRGALVSTGKFPLIVGNGLSSGAIVFAQR